MSYADNILSAMQSVPSFKPTTASVFSDWSVEPGDVVQIGKDVLSSSDDQTYVGLPVFSTDMTWNGSATATIQSSGNKKRQTMSKKERENVSTRKMISRYGGVSMSTHSHSVTLSSDGKYHIGGVVAEEQGGFFNIADTTYYKQVLSVKELNFLNQSYDRTNKRYTFDLVGYNSRHDVIYRRNGLRMYATDAYNHGAEAVKLKSAGYFTNKTLSTIGDPTLYYLKFKVNLTNGYVSPLRTITLRDTSSYTSSAFSTTSNGGTSWYCVKSGKSYLQRRQAYQGAAKLIVTNVSGGTSTYNFTIGSDTYIRIYSEDDMQTRYYKSSSFTRGLAIE